jgi:hypothetical protein
MKMGNSAAASAPPTSAEIFSSIFEYSVPTADGLEVKLDQFKG